MNCDSNWLKRPHGEQVRYLDIMMYLILADKS